MFAGRMWPQASPWGAQRQHCGRLQQHACGMPRRHLRKPMERRHLPFFQFAFSELQKNDAGGMPLVVVDLMDRRSGATVSQFSFSLDAEAFGVAKSIILGRFLPRTKAVYIEAARQIRQILNRVRHVLAVAPGDGTMPEQQPHKQQRRRGSPADSTSHGQDAEEYTNDTAESESDDFSEEDEGSDMCSEEDEADSGPDEERQQDEPADDAEMSSGTEASCTPDSDAPVKMKDGSWQHQQQVKRMRRSPPVSHSGDSAPDTSDSAFSDTDASESGRREEQAPPSDPRPLSPETRQLSKISEGRLEDLDRLMERFQDIEKRCKQPLDWVWESLVPSGDSAKETRNKAIGELSQCYGDLERLQCKAVDAIMTGDLSSGRSEARKKRKRLTQQITRLMDITEETVKRLRRNEGTTQAS